LIGKGKTIEVTRLNFFSAADNKASELHAFLQSLVPYITSSHGCLSCKVLRHNEKYAEFVVIETWSSIEDHKQSLAAFPKSEMQAAMALIGAPPHGDYYVS